MIDRINDLLKRVEEFRPKAAAEVEEFRIKVLGKKGELNALIKNVPGLRIEGHCLTVTGVCAECASKE